jgi:predicted site-specific integrase-resolvase
MDAKYLTVSEAARQMGLSAATLRRWHADGTRLPDLVTPGGQRRYLATSVACMRPSRPTSVRTTIAYARVSSHDQKEDLRRQSELLSAYCTTNGWKHEVISDLGSGLNFRKRGLRRLMELVLAGSVERLVITHRDRLLRFGAELVFSLCEHQDVEVVIINRGEQPAFEVELAKDVLEIVTVFSARLYGKRSHRSQAMIDAMAASAKA